MVPNQPSLRDQAIELYNGRPSYIKAREVSDALGISMEWLRMFSAGKIPNPGVNTVENLIIYINSRKAV